MKLYDHMELYLGKISEGWAPEEEGFNIQVVRFNSVPFDGISTYATLGLSNFILNINSKQVRQELIFSAYDTYPADEVASFLMTFAEYIANGGTGLLRGEIKMGPPLIRNVKSNGVYASIPVVFADELQVFNGGDSPVVFVWLIPITDTDAHFVIKNGWNKFEEELEQNNCDLWDLNSGKKI